MIIAIDGLAGSGKSSTAKIIAKKIGFSYFSTGKMYRSITCYCIENNLINSLPESLLKDIDDFKIIFKDNDLNRVLINDKDYSKHIYSKEVSKHVSLVSSIEKVRTLMVKLQRHVSKNHNIVCEGRDIGTVVFPNADYKFFFRADIKSRVNRRYIEIKSKNNLITKKKLKSMIANRDYKDMNRKVSPLKKAKDAILVVTTNMTMDEQVDFIIRRIGFKKK